MTEEYIPYTIEYDEMCKSWKVKLKGKEVDCDSESDANVISNIPCLLKELEDKSSQYNGYLIQRLKRTVELIKNYQINSPASRKLSTIYKNVIGDTTSSDE